MATPVRPKRRAWLPQLEARTPLVAIAAARQVLEEASLWLGEPLPSRYAAALAFRAKITFAHSASFRRGFSRRADAGRERLYVFLRHWLAARLHADRRQLFQKLPAGYCTGEPLTARAAAPAEPGTLSNEARLLLAV
ncbi:MAG: hypothetical protein ABIZ81_18085 [Opitutaceae bacterium]